MFESAKRNHAYDAKKAKQSTRRIWQGPGHYHIIYVQSGNPDWLGYWSSARLGKLPNKAALAEFLDYATHVLDNARKVGMVSDDLPVVIYAFHEAQMPDHCRILGIPDARGNDGAWMKVTHRHPFVPVSYTRMQGFDDIGEMDFTDMREDIQQMAAAMEQYSASVDAELAAALGEETPVPVGAAADGHATEPGDDGDAGDDVDGDADAPDDAEPDSGTDVGPGEPTTE